MLPLRGNAPRVVYPHHLLIKSAHVNIHRQKLGGEKGVRKCHAGFLLKLGSVGRSGNNGLR